jgi:hypothetical protein
MASSRNLKAKKNGGYFFSSGFFGFLVLNSLATESFFGYTLYPTQNNGLTFWKGISHSQIFA